MSQPISCPPGRRGPDSMIKLLTLLVRKSDLTHAQFVQIWADKTPALIATADLCRRYVQYRLHPDRVWPPGTPQLDLQLDGIEELWLEGSIQQTVEVLQALSDAGISATSPKPCRRHGDLCFQRTADHQHVARGYEG